MSAIGGVWRLDGAPSAADECARVLNAQAIYGPHASGQWNDGDLALGRRLFRLLPEDRYDTQPLIGASGAALVADIRLDNRADLQGELCVSAADARSLCDAGLLLAAWERWGEACFDHLVGVYAFAVWEPAKRRLILARDPLGQRPLHYHRTAGRLVFASMPAGVLTLADSPAAPDEARLTEFMAQVPYRGPRSFYRDVERVEPGTLLVFGQTSARTQTHWSPRYSPGLGVRDDLVEALRAHLDQAVEAQLRGLSDTVGAHLSSGWDSTAVTATAARLVGSRGGRVVAFTAVPKVGAEWSAPKNRHGDEGRLAAIQADLFDNIEHVRVMSDGRSPLDGFDADDVLGGGPVLNPCNRVWASDIDRAARARGISVLLTGDYGNATLTYRGTDGLRDLAAGRRWTRWLRQARGLVRAGHLRWRGVFAASFEEVGPKALWAALRRLNGEWVAPPGAHSALRPAVWAEITKGTGPSGDTFERRLSSLNLSDAGGYLKASLARWGVDLRSPLADRRLVEFCLSIPWEQIVADGAAPFLPQVVLADRVAPQVLCATTRGYQAVDWHVGLSSARAELEAELDRLEQWAPTAAILDLPRLRRLLRDWPKTGWEQQSAITNYRVALQRGVVAGRFARRVTGTNA